MIPRVLIITREGIQLIVQRKKERSKFGRKYQKLSLCHDKFEIISDIFQLILQINYSVLHSIRCSPGQKSVSGPGLMLQTEL